MSRDEDEGERDLVDAVRTTPGAFEERSFSKFSELSPRVERRQPLQKSLLTEWDRSPSCAVVVVHGLRQGRRRSRQGEPGEGEGVGTRGVRKDEVDDEGGDCEGGKTMAEKIRGSRTLRRLAGRCIVGLLRQPLSYIGPRPGESREGEDLRTGAKRSVFVGRSRGRENAPVESATIHHGPAACRQRCRCPSCGAVVEGDMGRGE